MNEILNEMKRRIRGYNYQERVNAQETIDNLKVLLDSDVVNNFCEEFGFRVQIFRGVGKYPKSPWVAFLSTKLNYTIQRGYYICYLVDVDISRIYLTVTSGTEGKKVDEMKQNAELGKDILGTDCNIDLGENIGRPYWYSIASSYAKEYDINEDYPTLEYDLINLMQMFNNSFVRGNTNTFDYTEALIAEAILEVEGKEGAEIITIEETPPPNQPNVPLQNRTVRISKRNYVAKTINDMKNGMVAEYLVVETEKARLINLGLTEYAERVEKKSDSGDGYGYDILSFDYIDDEVQEIYIEVKGTVKGINQSFFVSKNELDVSIDKGNQYFIYRVYDLKTDPKYYRVQGPLTENFQLIPSSYRVYNT